MPWDSSALRDLEIARLEVERRLVRGAAHAANNALTTIMGEASLVEETVKDCPEAVESCDSIRAEVERSGRIWRSVLAPRPATNQPDGSVDVVRLVADVSLLLDRSVGSRVRIQTRLPDDAPLAAVDPTAAETLLMTLVFHAADLCRDTLHVHLAVEPRERGVEMVVELAPPEVAPDFADALVDPARAANPATRIALESLPAALAAAGATVETQGSDAGACVRVRLPGS